MRVSAVPSAVLQHHSNPKLCIIILYYENDSAHTHAVDMVSFALVALFPT
jgi:hypothetical protein